MENLLKTEIQQKKESKWIGKILVGACGVAAVGISVVCFPFISPAFRKFTLPFIPATDNQLKNILSVLPRNKSANNRLLDIGSGDGRIVIASAKVTLIY
jgi:methylase of polypeptide subunit release factors